MSNNKLKLPDLALPEYDSSRPGMPSLMTLLLCRGGAALDLRRANVAEQLKKVGTPILERLPLVVRLHEVLLGQIVSGASYFSTKGTLWRLRSLFSWADAKGHTLTLDTLEEIFIQWTNHLNYRAAQANEITLGSAQDSAHGISSLLTDALGLEHNIFHKTKFYRGPGRNRSAKLISENNDSNQIFEFARILRETTDQLSESAIFLPLPITLEFSNGRTYDMWAGLTPRVRLTMLTSEKVSKYHRGLRLKCRICSEVDTSNSRRYPIKNARISAELLIFISQTGINLQQAVEMKVGNYNFQKYLDGYKVRRIYKNRRHGEVEFIIYEAYRPFFERYQAWRNSLYPKQEDRLFPYWNPRSSPEHRIPRFDSIRKICKQVGVQFITASVLRNSRMNWLFEHGDNPAITAEIGQHSLDTLHRNYIKPDHETASTEISRFHQVMDNSLAAAGPGLCVGNRHPDKRSAFPDSVAKPDCANPAGCLFCKHQRDIDSLDHVWQLASFRYLKSIELASNSIVLPPGLVHPATSAIDVLTQKLNNYKKCDTKHAGWVEEAEARIEEGRFHPNWDGFIQLMEVSE